MNTTMIRYLVLQHVGAILSTIVIGVLIYIVYLLTLVPKFAWELYETEIAVALTVIAISVGYKGFSPYLRKLGYDISDLEKRREEIKENEEQAEEHRIKLNDDFLALRNRFFLAGYTWTETFQSFPDSKQYLQHIFTAHGHIDSILRILIKRELEIKNLTPIPPIARQKVDQTRLDFENQFGVMQGHIRRKTRDLDGICEDCMMFKDEKSKRFQLMKTHLGKFTMPF